MVLYTLWMACAGSGPPGTFRVSRAADDCGGDGLLVERLDESDAVADRWQFPAADACQGTTSGARRFTVAGREGVLIETFARASSPPWTRRQVVVEACGGTLTSPMFVETGPAETAVVRVEGTTVTFGDAEDGGWQIDVTRCADPVAWSREVAPSGWSGVRRTGLRQ